MLFVSRHMQPIADVLESRYPGKGRRRIYREELMRVCNEFMASGLADPKFQIELAIGSDAKFWSCLSEALIYQRLKHLNPSARRIVGEGPDFLIETTEGRIWIEVVCPEPTGVPQDWLRIQSNRANSAPNEKILLRWTSAIKDKTDRLVGSAGGRVRGYLLSGTVSEGDVYVNPPNLAITPCTPSSDAA